MTMLMNYSTQISIYLMGIRTAIFWDIKSDMLGFQLLKSSIQQESFFSIFPYLYNIIARTSREPSYLKFCKFRFILASE